VGRKYTGERVAPGISWKSANPIRNPRRWLLFVVLVPVCILGFLHGPGARLTFDGQPILRGDGIIHDKLLDETGDPKYLVQVGVSLDDTHVAFDYVLIDPETWRKLSKGDRIGVLYQRSRTGNAIRIRETGMVALPLPNQ